MLSNVEAISDDEFGLLNTKSVALIGQVGNRDENWTPRAQPLQFDQQVDVSQLMANLPFTITAPSSTLLEYYRDRTNNQRYFIFAFNRTLSGSIQIQAAEQMILQVHTPGQTVQHYQGTQIELDLATSNHLQVMALSMPQPVPVGTPVLLVIVFSIFFGSRCPKRT
ncbi:hypothetical protein ACFL27_06515 [candidate division CSSED10-310 bacterium]|uniref:Uncharacterized protein n=1 Tax=candidate division CSSED10-310 bacterium TaxID=2855610 RepID=A0ABV6YUH6_UNCC1